MGTGEGGARCSGERQTRILWGILKEGTQISQKACGFGEMGPEVALKQGEAGHDQIEAGSNPSGASPRSSGCSKRN